MKKIYTSDDRALEEAQSIFNDPRAKAMKDHTSRVHYYSNHQNVGKPWNGRTCAGPKTYAYISGGCWLAACPSCKGYNDYVSYQTKFFYCFECGNKSTGGFAIPVIFPDNREEIEQAILARPVHDGPSKYGTQAAKAAVPVHSRLRRDWTPGTKVESIIDSNKKAGI